MHKVFGVAALVLFGACGTNAPVCGPSTCTGCCDAAGECQLGSSLDLCGGGGLQCTSCNPGLVCALGSCIAQCRPKTCAQLGLDCGSADDGCGGRLECGTCGAGTSCGGSGRANVCGPGTCAPKSCASEGAQCGSLSDGCSQLLDCGTCAGGLSCGGGSAGKNQCGCAPKTCAQLAKNCGTVDDGCGGTLACGTCTAGQTCGGGGNPNVCGAGSCSATTCAAQGKNCGLIPDGCGQMLSCGACSGFETCGGAGVANVCGAICEGPCPSSYSCGGGVCRGGSPTALAFDVKSFRVSGSVTLNGANPVSNNSSCYAPGDSSSYAYRGTVTFTETTLGYRFSFPLAGCTTTAALFSGEVFPGTYRVTVTGSASNLPQDSFVAVASQSVTAAVSGLSLDVKSFSVSGTVTLNGANPVSNNSSCYAPGDSSSYAYRGTVTFTETTLGYRFSFPLAGCSTTAALFSGEVFPGTYRVTVTGSASNLPQDSFVAVASQAVSAPVSGLAFDVKSFRVSGSVTLNGANPVSNNSSCYAPGDSSSYAYRGTVTFEELTKGYRFTFPLAGCTTTAALFSGEVFPGTYRVSVTGSASNLPQEDFVAITSQPVSAAVSGLALDVKSLSVSGTVTLNGANPVSNNSSCYAPGDSSSYAYRGTVTFVETTLGYRFSFPLAGCTNTAALFGGHVFPGTYRVSVTGSASNLPQDSFEAVASQSVAAAVSGLALDVKSLRVSGSVTLNGANPVSNNSSCYAPGDSSSYAYRGSVTFTELTKGYRFTFPLAGCTTTAALFAGEVFPGTYRVSVTGSASDLPQDSFVAVTAQSINGAVSGLALDVKAISVSGTVTLNGANPVSNNSSCYAPGDSSSYAYRGTVSFVEPSLGYRFSFPLAGCTNTAALFGGLVFPGTYRVSVIGSASNLPQDSAVVVSRLDVP